MSRKVLVALAGSSALPLHILATSLTITSEHIGMYRPYQYILIYLEYIRFWFCNTYIDELEIAGANLTESQASPFSISWFLLLVCPSCMLSSPIGTPLVFTSGEPMDQRLMDYVSVDVEELFFFGEEIPEASHPLSVAHYQSLNRECSWWVFLGIEKPFMQCS